MKEIPKRNPELPQNVTFHGLRYSCVSIAINSGEDIKSIQNWVGHADVDTTLKFYAKVKQEQSKNETLKIMMNKLIQEQEYIIRKK